MPVDSNGNINPASPDAPPYSMGRKEYRKWFKRKHGTLRLDRIKK